MLGGWLKKRAYWSETMSHVQAVLFMIGDDGKLLKQHAGIKAAIDYNYGEGVTAPVAGVRIAAAMLGDMLEKQVDNDRKIEIVQELDAWAQTENPRSIRKGLREGTLQQDLLLTRCEWAILLGQDMLAEGQIDVHDFRILKDHIYGPLRGQTTAERTLARTSDAIDEIFSRPD